MDPIKILWADDEIDMLKPQLLFLKQKGYLVTTVTNGHDAVEECNGDQDFDVVFLDESMPGITGLEALAQIKESHPQLPCVMITKNEAENVMEEALGSQITDYLIKPVNPNQILLTLKKIIDNSRLVREKTTSGYQQDFRNILMEINNRLDHNEWVDIYKKIINWELKLDASRTEEMADILSMQKTEANSAFSKYIINEYQDWIKHIGEEGTPTFSPHIFKKKVFPLLDDKPTFFLLLDNLRFDQWKVLEPIFNRLFKTVETDHFYSILPTTTQYSRNAIFAGMMPLDISKNYREWWTQDNEEGGRNNHEGDLLTKQIENTLRKPIKHDYFKITNTRLAKQLDDNILNCMNNDLTAIVYNFIDTLSHARTEMEVIKELASDETAYRSLTKSWFEHSMLYSALEKIAQRDVRLIVATDHGTIRVKTPSKVVGDRETTPNIRYKLGRNLKYNKKDVLAITDPEKAGLPKINLSSSYIFAKEDKYFLYPNNYNHFNNYYRNTFQHGGISLEEMICPIITMESK